MATSFSKHPYAGTSYSGADMLVTITVKDIASHKNTTCALGELQTLSYSTHMERGSVRKLGNINVSDFTNGPRTIAGSLVFAVFNRHMIQPVLDDMGIKNALLPDELPPFDITVTFANEYGHSSVLRIYGVRLINEGEVLSTNDVYIENTYQYVASNIEMLQETRLESYNSITSDDKETSSSSEENSTTTSSSLNTSSSSSLNGSSPSPSLNFPSSLPSLPSSSSGVQENISDILTGILGDSNFKLPTEEPLIETIKSILTVEVDVEKSQAIFNVSIAQPELHLVLDADAIAKKTYKVLEHEWPFTLHLPYDKYVATLQDKEGNVLNIVVFDIPYPKPSKPYVTNITTNTLTGGVVDESIVSLIYIDDKAQDQTINLSGPTFFIKDLMPNTEYLLIAKDNYDTLSDTLLVKTLPIEDDIYYLFENFALQNGVDKQSLQNFYAGIVDKDKSFIEAMYDTYQLSMHSRIAQEKDCIMHLASYYDLALKQKNYAFDFKNKWLGLIDCGSKSTNFRIYTSVGSTQNATNIKGILKYQEYTNHILEKMITCKPELNYQWELRKNYLDNTNIQKIMQQAYNTRYGSMPINRIYSYYDYSLTARGAYIEVIDDFKLRAHYREEKAFFVFKEDLALDVAFKIPAENVVDFTTLPFYDKRNNYLIYLESDNKTISKSIILSKEKVTYNYGTILSLAFDRHMQDIIKELCIEQLSAFEMFTYGFYLLVNRKQLSASYIALFDTLFYSYTKESRVHFTRQDGKLCFKKEVDYLLFDNQGNFLEKGSATNVGIRLNGYIVWSTPFNEADCLNFENM